MEDKVCVITGANAGLEYETAKALAAQKAEVIMICRSKTKGGKALQEISASTGNPNIHLFLADLSSQKEIRETAAKISNQWPHIDVLVNNAAVVTSQRTLSEDGIELQFAVNHLAYFLLTHCLMNKLRSSPGARIVNVSSGNHRRGKIHFEDLNLSKNYHVLKAYNQSKLANVLFTYELDRRINNKGIKNVTVNALDPGTNYTDIGVKDTSFLHGLAWKIRRIISREAARGAACQVYVATDPDVEGISGKFWYNSKMMPSSKHSYDDAIAGRLWAVSKGLCKISDFFNP